MLGTTFIGQRYDPRLKQQKSFSETICTTATVSGSSTRYSTTNPSDLSTRATSTNTSSLEREISAYSSDQWHEDFSIRTSTAPSSFNYSINCLNNTRVKGLPPHNSFAISFRLPDLAYGNNTTLREHTIRTLCTAEVEAHLLDSLTLDNSSDVTNAGQVHLSTPNRDRSATNPLTARGETRHSPLTASSVNGPGSSSGDEGDTCSGDPDPSLVSSNGFAEDEEGADIPASEGTVISTRASDGDSNSHRHSRTSSSTTSSPVSPIIFRSRSSILGYVAISCNNDLRADPDIRLMPRWNGDLVVTDPPLLPSARSIEKTAWWKNTPLQLSPSFYQHYPQQEIEYGGDSLCGAAGPSASPTVNYTLSPNRPGPKTDKPLPTLPHDPPKDDDYVESRSLNTLFSIIFPCLPVGVSSGKPKSPSDSEKYSAKGSDPGSSATRTQGAIFGPIAMWFKKRQQGCVFERGNARKGILEVKIEREMSSTVDQ